MTANVGDELVDIGGYHRLQNVCLTCTDVGSWFSLTLANYFIKKVRKCSHFNVFSCQELMAQLNTLRRQHFPSQMLSELPSVLCRLYREFSLVINTRKHCLVEKARYAVFKFQQYNPDRSVCVLVWFIYVRISQIVYSSDLW